MCSWSATLIPGGDEPSARTLLKRAVPAIAPVILILLSRAF
jgi:hypothetical protein